MLTKSAYFVTKHKKKRLKIQENTITTTELAKFLHSPQSNGSNLTKLFQST